jgi:mono/diheme cytochrome c family protein
MPSFGGRLPAESIWRIVMYVQSITPPRPESGGEGGAVAEGRTRVMPNLGVSLEDARDISAYLYTLGGGRLGPPRALDRRLIEHTPGD